ncbi:hypothetical protein V5799_013788 [Amblyomma americanum]|uniref:Uncharacterized protein n=1 Tax=Amblyomma americanum TaxID=6943 RepID=A0AAQ4E4W1_AMBAM
MTASETTSQETPSSDEPSVNGTTKSSTMSDGADNSTDRGVPPKSLLCTYGVKLDSTMVFPPDGLCDFVFFDSLYKNDTNKLDGPYSPNFDYFLIQAKKSSVTTYGAGLDYGNIEDVQEFLDSSNAETTIEGLLGDGIRHYGFLNTPATLLRLEDVKRAFQALKSTAHNSVMYLQTEDIPATLAVSVAMFGRWYMPRYSDDGGASEHANYSLFSQCKETADEQLGSVTQVCKHPMWATKVYSSEHQAEYCYDKKMERTFAFDSSKTLISKLCSEKRRVPSAKYALAAFNLEYADVRNECGEGDFAQLRVLRQLVDYLHETFADASAYDGCVSISVSSDAMTGAGNDSNIVY